MEAAAYRELADIENAHWWFVARRFVLKRQIQRLGLPPNARILEVGAGTGGNLSMLAQFGQVTAVEADAFARQHASEVTGRPVLPGALPDELPVFDAPFDLICMFDVLEHVEQSEKSLRVLAGHLNPCGCLIIAVPAYLWLWTRHDEQLHHFRRYTAGRLARELHGAGLSVDRLTYFNTALFPLAVADRIFGKLSGRSPTGMKVPGRSLNAVLRATFASEAGWLDRGTFPFGLSVLGVASRR